MSDVTSVVDFETPLDALYAVYQIVVIGVQPRYALHEQRHVTLHSRHARLKAFKPAIVLNELGLNLFQVLKDKFIGDVFAHGRTITAPGDARKFNHPFRRAFSPKHPLAQPARRRRMPAGRLRSQHWHRQGPTMDQPETQSMEDRLTAAEKRIAAIETEVRATQATANFNRGEISDLRGKLARLEARGNSTADIANMGTVKAAVLSANVQPPASDEGYGA